jgi:hypothetical protein
MDFLIQYQSRRALILYLAPHGVYEIVLNGKLQLAVPDNQASANIMSLKFAISERIKAGSVKIPFILGDGSILYSIGRATADCALQSSPHSTRAYQFYIFLNPIEPVILGRKFLHDAGLSRYPKSLNRQLFPDDDNADARSVWTTRSLDHIEYSRWQIRVALRCGSTIEEIGVVYDRGSDINVMSFAYAQEIGMEIKWSQRHQESIHLADGSTTETLGFVYASIRFYGHLGQIPLRFVLIDSLPFHVAIENPFIEQDRIFEDVHDFNWTFTDGEDALLCMFCWHQGMSLCRQRESNPSSAPLLLKYRLGTDPSKGSRATRQTSQASLTDQTYRDANETAARGRQMFQERRRAALQASRNASLAQTPVRPGQIMTKTNNSRLDALVQFI